MTTDPATHHPDEATATGAENEVRGILPARYRKLRDAVVRLRMPGCMIERVESINEAARQLFLDEITGVVCDRLGGAPTLLKSLCQFELYFMSRDLGDKRGPFLVAFRPGRRNGHRPFRLFVAHPLESKHPDEELIVRLLPLPFTLELSNPKNGHSLNTDGLYVSARPKELLETQVYSPNPEDGSDERDARERFTRVAADLDKGVNPREAGSHAYHLKDRLALSVIRLLEGEDPKVAAEHIHEILAESLEAPVLKRILPEIWKKIRDDHELHYLPKAPSKDTERLQYLRARLPLSELQEQDEFLHWLPVAEVWDREQIWAELSES